MSCLSSYSLLTIQPAGVAKRVWACFLPKTFAVDSTSGTCLWFNGDSIASQVDGTGFMHGSMVTVCLKGACDWVMYALSW